MAVRSSRWRRTGTSITRAACTSSTTAGATPTTPTTFGCPSQLRLLRERFAEGTAEIFEHYGYPVPDVAVSAVPSEGFDLEGWVTPGAEPTAFLGEGDVVDLGDRSFEVLHVPGHTVGSIALWEPATGTLFTGDAAYVDDLLSWDDERTFRASIARLADVPASRVCAGHGRVFDGEELRALAATFAPG